MGVGKSLERKEFLVMMTKVITVSLDDIYADYGWNSRSQHDVTASQSDGVNSDEGLKEGEGFSGLCSSLEKNGQDNPVTVCEIKAGRSFRGNHVPFKYELVCGFRRYTALVYLRDKKKAVPGLKDGHILTMVREFNPLEARLLNIRENTDRSSLRPSDLTWGILQLKAQGLTGTQIAEQLNISAGYVAKLWKIASLPLPIIEHWRGTKVALSGIPTAANGEVIPTRVLSTIALSKIADTVAEQDEKTQMYVDLLLGRKPRESVVMVIDLPEERVRRAASFAAELVSCGLLAEGDLQWSKVVGPRQYGFLIPSGNLGNEPGPRLQKLWKLAKETYERTITERKAKS
jgi:transcriptional regulator with XRE-family HTH domain